MLSDKCMFMDGVIDRLKEVLTGAQIDAVMAAMSDEIKGFDVARVHGGELSDGDMDMFEAFLSAKALEGRSDKTIRRYRYELGRMLPALGAPIERVSVHHLRRYLSDKKAEGVSDSTLEGTRNIMSGFFGWLHKEGLIQRNPCVNLGVIKCSKVQRLPFSSTDIERMREACDSLRDRAIVSFLLSTGCRVSEAVALNVSDMDFASKQSKVFGKGKKERTVYMDDVTVMLIRRYLGERKDDSPALFIGRGTERMTENGIRRMLKRLEASSGVIDVHPHRFRRTLATNLINHGMSIQEVAAILGHESIDTTMTYVFTEQARVKSTYMRITA